MPARKWNPALRRTLILAGWTVAALLLLSPLWFRTFAFQTFNIPAASMMPTLLIGDYIAVSKYSYGFSQFSLPLSPPLFSGRIPDGCRSPPYQLARPKKPAGLINNTRAMMTKMTVLEASG